MSALDQLSSVDRALAEMRRQFEDEKNAIRDECRIATIERDLLREQLATARANEQRWQRIATQFVLQFDMVDKICADVRTAAMNVRQVQEQEEYVQEQDANATVLHNLCSVCGDPWPAQPCNKPGCPTLDQPCPDCGAKWGFEHTPTCPAVAGVNDEPLPEFLRNGNDNSDDPPDNAKLDPEFVQPQSRTHKLLKRVSPIKDQD